ncbi:MAG TPA: DUF6766 family protein [Candidatus Deferrimicrobium sp.]|nr:DUF6766 family protein [Candidatus Kapabacteria bacterium]HLP58954.1 DUF6766 family protein [Candidatus Deferrimicrobium sp.]
MKNKMKYGYLWFTLAFFLISLSGHWILAWFSYVDEQQEDNKPVVFSEYVVQTSRDMLENWQSEFLQLIWQVGGLSFLLFVGSPQSKEGNEREEEKLDLILHAVDKDADKKIKALDKKYPRK